MYSYSAEADDEVTCKEGDKIEIIENELNGWTIIKKGKELK
jgi:hypothetical protein